MKLVDDRGWDPLVRTLSRELGGHVCLVKRRRVHKVVNR
jgi:hypothetical protein